jgi:hypothetical protein
MRELFIYYRVHLQAVPAAKTAVVAMQTRLRQRHPELSARLLCRAEPDEASTQTWMETYAIDPMSHPAGIDAELQAEIDAEAHVLAAWIDGSRHVEAFRPCAW